MSDLIKDAYSFVGEGLPPLTWVSNIGYLPVAF